MMIALTFDVANDTLIAVAALVVIIIGVIWLLGRWPWWRR